MTKGDRRPGRVPDWELKRIALDILDDMTYLQLVEHYKDSTLPPQAAHALLIWLYEEVLDLP